MAPKLIGMHTDIHVNITTSTDYTVREHPLRTSPRVGEGNHNGDIGSKLLRTSLFNINDIKL